MEGKLTIFEVDGQLLFHAEEIKHFVIRERKDCATRLLSGLRAADMLDSMWLYYYKLDTKKLLRTSNIGTKTTAAFKELKYYLDKAVAEYREKKGIVALAEDPELKRREDVIKKSNELFANPNSITAYHRYMENMIGAGVVQTQAYAQFIVGLAESIVETQDKYRKEGKV